jgi:hypothetical protein
MSSNVFFPGALPLASAGVGGYMYNYTYYIDISTINPSFSPVKSSPEATWARRAPRAATDAGATEEKVMGVGQPSEANHNGRTTERTPTLMVLGCDFLLISCEFLVEGPQKEL